jgi:hypothetical protein
MPIHNALLAGGIVLMVFGVMASTSFTSDISRFFTGSPTGKAIWMLLCGTPCAESDIQVIKFIMTKSLALGHVFCWAPSSARSGKIGEP